MKAEDRFRKFIHERGPAKAIKVCSWCGKITVHQLNYCRSCGKVTEWVKFKNWIHYSTYVLSRRRNGKLGGIPEGWPRSAFESVLIKEMGFRKAKLYLANLKPSKIYYIVLEECGFECPFKKC